MFSLTTSHKFLLYRKAADFRKGFDGLCGLARNELDREPTSGEVFVFINYKRLEQGTIALPVLTREATSCTLSFPDLVMMIEGISMEKVVRQPRFNIL